MLLCFSEVLSPTEHAARLQRSEILEEGEQGGNSYTLQGVEKVMKKVRTLGTLGTLGRGFTMQQTVDDSITSSLAPSSGQRFIVTAQMMLFKRIPFDWFCI